MLLLPLCLVENCQKGPLNADIFCCCVFVMQKLILEASSHVVWRRKPEGLQVTDGVICTVEQPGNLHFLSVCRCQHRGVKSRRKQSPGFSGWV